MFWLINRPLVQDQVQYLKEQCFGGFPATKNGKPVVLNNSFNLEQSNNLDDSSLSSNLFSGSFSKENRLAKDGKHYENRFAVKRLPVRH